MQLSTGLGFMCAAAVAGLAFVGRFGEELALRPAPAPERAAMMGSAANPPAGPRKVVLQSDSRGHFLTDVSVNNRFIRVLVDTGASSVALSADDATRIGARDLPLDGVSVVNTANGALTVKRVRIPELRLQGLTVRDVEAVILPPGASVVSLLGMSFLKRLNGFEMQGHTLVLRQ